MKLEHLSAQDPIPMRDAHVVVGSSLFYDKDFENCFSLETLDRKKELLSEEVSGYLVRAESPTDSEAVFNFSTRPRLIAKIDAEIVPINLLHPQNYFHFLVCAAPSLLHFLESRRLNNENVIISGVLHPNIAIALKLITGGSLPIMEGRRGDAFFSRSIFALRDCCYGNELKSGAMPKLEFRTDRIVKLRDLFRRLWSNENGKKIFVVRRSKQRNLLNMKDLAEQAARVGFMIVAPEELSFRDQVSLFSQCSHVVGPTGAWLANMMFMRPDAKVLVLYPDTCKEEKSFWSRLGESFNLRVSDFYSPHINLNKYQPIHSDFTVDMQSFRSLLSAA